MLAGYKAIVNTAKTKLSSILKFIPKLPLEYDFHAKYLHA